MKKSSLNVFRLVVCSLCLLLMQTTISLAAQPAQPTLALSADTITVGQAPATLAINGGAPPFYAQQTGGTVGVDLRQTSANSFVIAGRAQGTAVVSVFDSQGKPAGSKTITVKIPPVTLTLTPETFVIGTAPAVFKVTGGVAPYIVRQTGGSTTAQISQTAADTFYVAAMNPGTAIISLQGQTNGVIASKTLTAVLPQATLTLAPEAINFGSAPAVLKIGGITSPFSVRQTAGTVGVGIQQTAADSFNLIGQGPGTAVISLFDTYNNNLGSRTLTINLPPLNVSLSADAIAVNREAALLKITSGMAPYYARQTGGTVGVSIQQTAADQFSISGRAAGTAVLTIGDQGAGRTVTKNITVR